LKQENENNKQQIVDFESQIETLNQEIEDLKKEKDELLASHTSVYLFAIMITHQIMFRLVMKFRL